MLQQGNEICLFSIVSSPLSEFNGTSIFSSRIKLIIFATSGCLYWVFSEKLKRWLAKTRFTRKLEWKTKSGVAIFLGLMVD